jgi:hypothetical protein
MSHYWKLGSPSSYRRRVAAQCLFLASGVFAVLLFAGVEVWSKAIISILLAAACILESTISLEYHSRISRRAILILGLLLGWLLLSVCPWPASWASWIAPGQHRLLGELEGFKPPILRISMAPKETQSALFLILGGAVVVYLSWFWASDSFFRRVLLFGVVTLGAIVAGLGFYDQIDNNNLLYGFRSTTAAGHWGPFINRNHFANYMNFSALIGLGLFFRYALPKKNQRRSPKRSLIGLIGASGCALMSLATGSRGGVLSLVIGLLFLTAFLFLSDQYIKRFKVMIIILVLAFVSTFIWARPHVHRAVDWITAPQNSSDHGRLEIWKDIGKIGPDTEWRGMGAGTFRSAFPIFQTSIGQKTVAYAENEYLHTWAEWGLIGSGLWLILGLMILYRAVHCLRSNPREWQIAGWSAIVMIAFHCLVDFPLHIPANAWVALALLGVLIRGKVSENDSDSVQDGGGTVKLPSRRWVVFALGVIFLVFGVTKLVPQRNELELVEKYLMHGNYKGAWESSREALRVWPFYWRAHELAGCAAIGLPSMEAEAKRCFERAQHLAPANARISFRAASAFYDSNPELARTFLETAMQRSDEPNLLLREMLGLVSKNPQRAKDLWPLALNEADRWNDLRVYLNQPEILMGAKEVAELWLSDLKVREKIVGALISDGQAAAVIEAFELHPPRTQAEFFWQALAFHVAGNDQLSANAYRSFWKKYSGMPLEFSDPIPVTEISLRQANLDFTNLALQRKVAESLFMTGHYEQSIPFWHRVRDRLPDDEMVQYGFAVSLQESQNWKESVMMWRRLVQNRWKF